MCTFSFYRGKWNIPLYRSDCNLMISFFTLDIKSLLKETKDKLWQFLDNKMNSTPPQLPGSSPPVLLCKTDEKWLLEEDIGSVSLLDEQYSNLSPSSLAWASISASFRPSFCLSIRSQTSILFHRSTEFWSKLLLRIFWSSSLLTFQNLNYYHISWRHFTGWLATKVDHQNADQNPWKFHGHLIFWWEYWLLVIKLSW